jgi:hypothetical protein
VLIGTVSTEAYYTQFGLRYQFLGLSAEHLIYRGLTSVISAPFLALPYLATCAWLAYGEAAAQRWSWKPRDLVGVTYTMLVVVIVLTYTMSAYAGATAAKADMTTGSTTLPVVKKMIAAADADAPCDVAAVCRLLYAGPDVVYVFVPTSDRNTVPTMKRIESKDYHEIDTGTQ